MNISQLGTETNGTRSFEIRTGTLSYRALLRCIRKIPGTTIVRARHYSMTDDTEIDVQYKGIIITIDTPFSDYILSCTSSSTDFDEFINKLRDCPVKWWNRIL